MTLTCLHCGEPILGILCPCEEPGVAQGRALRESDVEAYLVQEVKALGGEVRKVKWIGRSGAPDRLVMLPERTVKGGSVRRPTTGPFTGKTLISDRRIDALSAWVEVKAPGETPDPHQVREHERMRAMGQRVEVIDSREGVDRLLGKTT